MMTKFYAWLAATDGVTGIEYGLIVAGVSCATAVGTVVMGDEIAGLFGTLADVGLDRGAGLEE